MRLSDIYWITELDRLSFPDPWPASAFQNELLHNQQAYYVVALIKNQLIGYYGCWIKPDEIHITNLAVHPYYRGLGLGTELIKQIFTLASMLNKPSVILEVRVSNLGAQKLYYRMGFMQEGRRVGYYLNDGEDALIMRRKIAVANKVVS
jgi:ribosomal-protein-alanine N-acetyltransferase